MTTVPHALSTSADSTQMLFLTIAAELVIVATLIVLTWIVVDWLRGRKGRR